MPPPSPPELPQGALPDRDLEATAGPTAPEELARLAVDPNDGIRSRVAANPSTPLAVLRALARDRDATVRGQVGSRPLLPGLLRLRVRDRSAARVSQALEQRRQRQAHR